LLFRFRFCRVAAAAGSRQRFFHRCRHAAALVFAAIAFILQFSYAKAKSDIVYFIDVTAFR
jgi:hypothetical protein